MKIHTKQKNAKEWKKTLNKLNQAQVGKIALVYEDEENKKRQGYLDLTEIELELGEKIITLGDLLLEHEISTKEVLEKAKNDIIKLEKEISKLNRKLETVNKLAIMLAERGAINEEDIIG